MKLISGKLYCSIIPPNGAIYYKEDQSIKIRQILSRAGILHAEVELDRILT